MLKLTSEIQEIHPMDNEEFVISTVREKCTIVRKIVGFMNILYRLFYLEKNQVGRGIITLMIWNIPLYFNVYFILYMSYLIMKSIALHKIELPYITH